jgi:hypothetical protein
MEICITKTNFCIIIFKCDHAYIPCGLISAICILRLILTKIFFGQYMFFKINVGFIWDQRFVEVDHVFKMYCI